MNNQANNENFCPFWDAYGKRICRLVDSGLFIPTRDHILRFCESEQYVTCYHYSGKEMSKQEIQARQPGEKPVRNRRLYTRIPMMQKLSVSRYSLAREKHEDVLDSHAKTVDLSLGGMRIETSASINVNQIISFTFSKDFKPPGFKGKGEIRWIQPGNTNVPTQAGLAFIDSNTVKAVRSHLLGMGEKLLHLSGF